MTRSCTIRTARSYVVIGAMAKYRVTDRLTAQLNIENLLDKPYYSSVGPIGFYGTRRSAMFTLRYGF